MKISEDITKSTLSNMHMINIQAKVIGQDLKLDKTIEQ